MQPWHHLTAKVSKQTVINTCKNAEEEPYETYLKGQVWDDAKHLGECRRGALQNKSERTSMGQCKKLGRMQNRSLTKHISMGNYESEEAVPSIPYNLT